MFPRRFTSRIVILMITEAQKKQTGTKLCKKIQKMIQTQGHRLERSLRKNKQEGNIPIKSTRSSKFQIKRLKWKRKQKTIKKEGAETKQKSYCLGRYYTADVHSYADYCTTTIFKRLFTYGVISWAHTCVFTFLYCITWKATSSNQNLRPHT